jgi:hypothetical protein
MGAAVRMYVDGQLSTGTAVGTMLAANASLTNTADFYVGRASSGGYFAGDIDFLRVSRGTLTESRTTIQELYAWQFDGPFLKDFAGNAPVGARDAGALEYVPLSVGSADPDLPAPTQISTATAQPFGGAVDVPATQRTAGAAEANGSVQAAVERRLALRGSRGVVVLAEPQPQVSPAVVDGGAVPEGAPSSGMVSGPAQTAEGPGIQPPPATSPGEPATIRGKVLAVFAAVAAVTLAAMGAQAVQGR